MIAQSELMLRLGVGLLVDLSELAELLLASGIPDLEEHASSVGVEGNEADIDSLSWLVDFLEFSSSVSLHEGGLSDTTVADHDKLELGVKVSLRHVRLVVLHLDFINL